MERDAIEICELIARAILFALYAAASGFIGAVVGAAMLG